MNFRDKILSSAALKVWRDELRASKKKLVVTNGCFDLLHAGHVTYLEAARKLGDALLVGVNGDAGVRQLKGEGRPINHETDRATVLSALEMVSAVQIFSEKTASQFLKNVAPDIYVKGGDYELETLDKEERKILEEMGAKIFILPIVPGRSTTSILEKISRL